LIREALGNTKTNLTSILMKQLGKIEINFINKFTAIHQFSYFHPSRLLQINKSEVINCMNSLHASIYDIGNRIVSNKEMERRYLPEI
jgi:hypothetical protein